MTVNSKGKDIKPGDEVYYRGYLALVIAYCGRTRFTGTPKWFIEPYPDLMRRRVVKETKLIVANL